ncbi:hypothetical protein B0E45_29370 [Sinorhizobium sp. A49]|nr:hypothetical protein B0E45_29370 [Sinorhizobium sp. A49]
MARAQAIAIGGEGRDVTAGGLLAYLGWRFAADLGGGSQLPLGQPPDEHDAALSGAPGAP